MSGLARMAKEFYLSGGYTLAREADDFFEAVKASGNRVLVWIDDTGRSASDDLSREEKAARDAREAELLGRIQREQAAAPDATGFLLLPRRLGLSASFTSAATKALKGGIRVPVEFFDLEYLFDEGGKAARNSVAAPVFLAASRVPRVAQPFFRRNGLGPQDREMMQGDLVEHFKSWLAATGPQPRICIIDGSAGGGKTVAFNALAKHAYDRFIERKREKGVVELARRPIIFLPQHLRLDGQVGHVEDILAAVQDTDMAKATTPEQGRWLLKNGFTLWMFDGLDEFYEGSDGFFDEIAHLLDEPGSQARFLLCTRDSLLSSSSRLRAFVDSRLSGARDIELLEIAPWGEDAWRAMAETELGKGARAENFVGALRSSPVTGEMARLPFYCRVMLDRFKADGVLPADPLEVLDFIFDSMVAREHGKAIFRWKDFVDEDLLDAAMEEEGVSPAAESAVERQAFLDYLDREGRESVVELICALAHALRRGAAPHGSFELEAADIRDIAGKAYVSNDLGNEVHGRRLQVLVQFAFFGAGVRAGTVDFTHPILADYLAGRYALTLLERAAQSLAKNVELRPSDLKIPQGAIRQAVGAGAVDRNSIFFQTVKRGAKDDALIAAFLKRMTQERFPEPHIQDFMNLIST